MLTRDQHRLLALFGDAQEHSFFEIAKLSSVLLKKSDRQIWLLFKRMLEYNWIERSWKSAFEHLDFYKISDKGDEFFRLVQVWRITRNSYTDENIRHFQQFDRSVNGKKGVTGLGTELSEKMAGLKEKFPNLYR